LAHGIRGPGPADWRLPGATRLDIEERKNVDHIGVGRERLVFQSGRRDQYTIRASIGLVSIKAAANGDNAGRLPASSQLSPGHQARTVDRDERTLGAQSAQIDRRNSVRIG
jgi:hypothetical protein